MDTLSGYGYDLDMKKEDREGNMTERQKKIRKLGREIRKLCDRNTPYSYRKVLFTYLTEPNVKFQEDCKVIGIDPVVWNEIYKEMFSFMFREII